MYALTTKYYGPTDFKGARIRVQYDKKTRWYSYRYEASDGGRHIAVEDMARKEGVFDEKHALIFGTLPDGETVAIPVER